MATRRPRLGRVLLEAGLLSEEQLEEALAEQQTSDRTLGAILVERGYVSEQLVASALAEQHGGVLRTEYGVAVGLGRSPEPDGGGRLAALGRTPLVTSAPGGGQAPVAPLRTTGREQGAAVPGPAELDALRDALERAEQLAARYQQALGELDAERERLAGLRRQADALLAAIKEAQPAAEPYVDDRHYLLVPSDSESGYDYLERSGAAPPPGSELDLTLAEGRVRMRVTRHGQVRVPGARMACAYLERL